MFKDSTNKKCIIESGKAEITCTPTGTSILIDKCVTPGVNAMDIHLNDPNCTAFNQNATSWKIVSSSVGGCGATRSFENEIFTFSNTLHFGRSIINSIVVGRSAAVDFSCKFNSHASAIRNYNSNNVVASVSFNAGTDNNDVLDFDVDLNFYESEEYSKQVNYSNHQTAVGNTLYAQTSVV